MYILTQHTSPATPRAYRLDGESEIWIKLVPGTKLAMEPAEVQLIIAERWREVAAVDAARAAIAAATGETK